MFDSLLNFNIVQSERWLALGESDVSVATVDAWFNSTAMAPDDGHDYATLRPLWNTYPTDDWRGVVANFTPLLMLNGDLDPSTPFEQARTLAAQTPERQFVQVPLAGHVSSLLANVGISCPIDIVFAFAKNATVFGRVTRVDASCVARMPVSIDFAGDTTQVQQSALRLLGTADLWGLSR
jgi:pimeloyl-ACP methyl ester carboxylesterase